ncbi:WbqC family protein [Planococcus shenhongbingii]|uniref:WbqC family protein n=1 Tax=Planococcus shenhongbingii TaxID=3058398 RepID=A0ABT8N9R1_9BACL|nr:WbqC family protein [Planococcus sp. N017]MDN7244596.1 WbqC family protein [Planococcus sp. N017]
MKIVLMQPYFFPYLGYFTLLKKSDLFVVFDTAQYIRRGWVHRNRIIGPNGEPTYINALIIKAPQDTPIHHIQLNDLDRWKQEVLRKIEVYKYSAPNYREVYQLVEQCLNVPVSYLADLNVHCLHAVSDYLEIPRNIIRLSEQNLSFDDIHKPDDWGLKISQYYGAETYINAPGGQEFYNKDKYEKHHIDMLFYKTKLTPYNQNLPAFQPGLSIIDVMMFNTKKEIHQMLDDYEIL